MISALLLLRALAASTEASEATLGFSHDSYGNFTVSLNGKLWLSGGETRVYDYSSSDGTLKLLSQASRNNVYSHCSAAALTVSTVGL